MASSTRTKFLLWLISTLAFSAVAFWLMMKGELSHVGSGRWPSVQGTVTTVPVIKSVVGTHETKFYGRVGYAYVVGGERYESDQTEFAAPDTHPNPRDAAADVAQYAVGMPVTVYYDPADAKTAVLIPGLSRGTIAIMCIAAVLSFWGVGMVMYFTPVQILRLWRETHPSADDPRLKVE